MSKSGEIAIRVNNVSKDFILPHLRKSTVKSIFTDLFNKKETTKKETQHALQDISFEIKKGEFFGIVGRNGSGKSTLLKILAGIYQPTKGSVDVNGRLVPFIELGVGFNPELTGRENVYLNGSLLNFSKSEIDKMYDEIVDFAELERFMDQKLKNYSSGMQVRLAFSMAIRADADILLVDEVLAVGDADFQRKCFSYFKQLKKNKKTVVFVSHDMGAVKEFCDRAILIEKSKVISAGESSKIADEYSRLFVDATNEKKQVKNTGIRWGNGDALMEKVECRIDKETLHVSINVKVKSEHLGKILYGLHVLSADGKEVTAMNNRMIDAPDIIKPKLNSLIQINWKMLNIFNDGDYSVTCTMVDDQANTLDWIIDASRFSVKRLHRSTTYVIPPIEVDFQIK